jgi:hypothetical protein
VDKFVRTVKWWFIVGLIVGGLLEILTGHFDVRYILAAGFAYILYPIFGYYLFFMANDSGTQQAFVNSIIIFGSLAFTYILIPIVIFAKNSKDNE